MKSDAIIIGGGFIGKNLARSLAEEGVRVVIVEKQRGVKTVAHSKIEYIFDDYSNLSNYSSLINEKVDVIHLAHEPHKENILFENAATFYKNIDSFTNLIRLISEKKSRLIFASSGGTIYGEANYLPLDEKHPVNPVSIYGLTKLTMENFLVLFATLTPLKFISIRPANPYGPGQYPFLGQGFVATTLASLLANQPLSIFGDGKNLRDYIYIDDLVDGIKLLMEKGRDNSVYNLGTGIGTSNLEIVDLVSGILGSDKKNLIVNYLPTRSSDVIKNVLDCKKMFGDTGWSPKVNLEDGLFKTLKWMKDSDFGNIEK